MSNGYRAMICRLWLRGGNPITNNSDVVSGAPAGASSPQPATRIPQPGHFGLAGCFAALMPAFRAIVGRGGVAPLTRRAGRGGGSGSWFAALGFGRRVAGCGLRVAGKSLAAIKRRIGMFGATERASRSPRPATRGPLFALLLLAAFCPTLPAQPRLRVYCVTHSASLSTSATAVTIQQPATGSENVRGREATVYASAACGFTVERNGTAATQTALTPWVGRDDIPQTPKATAWGDSDVGAGTSGPHHNVPAGGTFPLALYDIELRGNGTAKNFTLRTDDCTGDVEINVCWEEF